MIANVLEISPLDRISALQEAEDTARDKAIEWDHRECLGVESTDSDFPHPCRCQKPSNAALFERRRIFWQKQAIFFASLRHQVSGEHNRYNGQDWPMRLIESNQPIHFFDGERAARQFGPESLEAKTLTTRWISQREL